MKNTISIRIILPLVFAASLLSSCGKKNEQTPMSDTAKMAAAPVKEGQGKGILRGIDTSGKTLSLDLGNIPGIMEAMTMSYAVDPTTLLSAAKVGDSVAVTVQDRGQGDFVVTAVKTISK